VSLVPAEPLRPIIEGLIAEHGVAGTSALTGLPQRRLWGIRNGESELIRFDTADKIVTFGIGPHAWHSDETFAAFYR
jgi:hypothetical protein